MVDADIGLEPIKIDHEPIMLPYINPHIIITRIMLNNPKGIRTPVKMVKTLYLNR